MFAEPFNFAKQRTGLQAFGWYLVFLLIALVVGMVLGGIAALGHFFPGTSYEVGLKMGTIVAPIFTFVVAVLVVWARPTNVINLALGAGAVLVSLLLGWIGGGILLAYLTTRPAT